MILYTNSFAECENDFSTTYHSIASIISMLSMLSEFSNVAVVTNGMGIQKNVFVYTILFNNLSVHTNDILCLMSYTEIKSCDGLKTQIY